MARLTIDGGVRPDQWESIVMAADRLNGNIPALDGVAGIAIRSELPAVNVRVAVRAFLADVGENQFDMALGALHFFVHALQRVGRLVVIKLRDAANGLPTQRRVTIFAGDVKPGTVRILCGCLLRLRRAGSLRAELEGKKKDGESGNFSQHGDAPSPSRWHPSGT
jgi:hypothetical protein